MALNSHLSDQIGAFIAHLRNERGLSPHTRRGYRRDLIKLAEFCASHNLNEWGKVNSHHVRAFVAARHRQGLGGRSLQRLLSSLRVFFDYLIRESRLDHNPASGVRAPKSARRLPEVLDVDQVGRLLAIDDTDVLALRDRAIMELVYSSGLRLSELVSLNLPDVDLADAVVHVARGKGRKARQVPIGSHAREALEAWLDSRAALCVAEQEALFVSRNRRRLSPRSVQQRIRHWAKRQGIAAGVYPHMLRHSFASHLLESSSDLRAVQELLGHANLSTTQIYTHLDFQHLATVYDAAHPRAKRRGGG